MVLIAEFTVHSCHRLSIVSSKRSNICFKIQIIKALQHVDFDYFTSCTDLTLQTHIKSGHVVACGGDFVDMALTSATHSTYILGLADWPVGKFSLLCVIPQCL